MGREQIQVPFDTNSNGSSDKDQDSAPKTLGRPTVASSLSKPRAARKLSRHCSCGNIHCRYPADHPNDWEYQWVYKDALTQEVIEDASLPKRGAGGV